RSGLRGSGVVGASRGKDHPVPDYVILAPSDPPSPSNCLTPAIHRVVTHRESRIERPAVGSGIRIFGPKLEPGAGVGYDNSPTYRLLTTDSPSVFLRPATPCTAPPSCCSAASPRPPLRF